MKALDYESMNKSLSYKIPISPSEVELFRTEFEKFKLEGKKELSNVYEKLLKVEKENFLFLSTLSEYVLKCDSAFFYKIIEERENSSKTNLPGRLFE